jgi:hypothetical protein
VVIFASTSGGRSVPYPLGPVSNLKPGVRPITYTSAPLNAIASRGFNDWIAGWILALLTAEGQRSRPVDRGLVTDEVRTSLGTLTRHKLRGSWTGAVKLAVNTLAAQVPCPHRLQRPADAAMALTTNA